MPANGSVLRRAYVEVEPSLDGFDRSLTTQLRRADPGGRAGKQIGGQLNRALSRLDLAPIDVKADPRSAFAAISATEARLRELSGDSATVEVKVQTERALGELRRFRKQLGEIGEDAGPEVATGFAARFAGRLGPLLATMPIQGPLSTALVGAGVAAAPLLGSVIAGAIIGGAGVGGIAGGLALAAKDERVQQAADDMAGRIEGRLLRAAGVFVAPTLQSIKQLEQAVDEVGFERIFADAARYVPTLTGAATSAVSDLGTAVEKLIANAGPAVDAISDGVADITETAASGLASLTDNGESSADALRTLFATVDMGVDSVFRLINVFAELYEIGQKVKADFVLQTILRLGELADASDEAGGAARRSGSGFFGQAEGIRDAGAAAELAKENQAALTEANKALAAAQANLNNSLAGFAPRAEYSTRLVQGLRQATQQMYGAAIAGSEANEQYQASWDALSASVQANGRSLRVSTEAGRANRDSLQALLGASNEMYYANIAQGQSTDQAAKKHRERTAAVREEARRLGLNREETQKLINTYGRIPPAKSTDLLVKGVTDIITALNRIYIQQRALAEGKTVNQVRYEGTAAMRSLLAGGGPVHGPGGPTEDKVPAMLSAGEYVIRASSTSSVGQEALEHINRYGELPQFASGGIVAPIERRNFRYPINVRNSYVMPLKEALARVIPAVPPGGRTSDWIERVARMLVPGIRTLSKDRPGARTLSGSTSYHALGRAVDFEPSMKLARLWNERYLRQTKELISPYQQYNIHNGSRHTYTGAVWRQHNFAGGNAHDHIAMDDGGVRMLEPGLNVVPNWTGKREPIYGPAAPVIINIPAGAVIAGKQAAEDLLVEAYTAAKRKRRIP